jgi:hypothetical protein
MTYIPHSYRHRIPAWGLALWLAIGAAASVAAQAPEPEPDPGPENETAVEPIEDPNGSRPAGRGGEMDVFVPTEEISEDFTVSFPVDI